MRPETRLAVARAVCRPLPPVIAQAARRRVYPATEARRVPCEVIGRSVTGSALQVSLRDFHGFPFAVHGYHTWRNLVVAALAVRGRQNPTIVEVGANVGTETVGFADIAGPTGCVLAVEPDEANIRRLEALALRCGNVTVVRAAATDSAGTVEFIPPPDDIRTGIGRMVSVKEKPPRQPVTVAATTVDEIVQGRSVVAIFSDTEGHEVAVLRGAAETIKTHRPLIVVEGDQAYLERAGSSVAELLDLLAGFGYEVRMMARWGLTDQLGNGNWLAIPSERVQEAARISRWLTASAGIPAWVNPLLRRARR